MSVLPASLVWVQYELTRHWVGLTVRTWLPTPPPAANSRSASLGITAYTNESDDFDVTLDEIHLGGVTISFREPQTFAVGDLEDEDWMARLVYSWPLLQSAIARIWAGYGESEATSATTSDLTEQSIKKFFEQSFSLDESILYLGASIAV